jgi:hypothetical protein
MTLRTRLSALERAAAAAVSDGAIPAPTLEEFKQWSDDDKIRFLRGKITFIYPPRPDAAPCRGYAIEQFKRLSPSEKTRFMSEDLDTPFVPREEGEDGTGADGPRL